MKPEPIENLVDTTYYKPSKPVTSLEDAKQAINELQLLGTALFMQAWKNGWHTELAAYSMTLKQKGVENANAGN
jgi:hypothetical protein